MFGDIFMSEALAAHYLLSTMDGRVDEDVERE